VRLPAPSSAVAPKVTNKGVKSAVLGCAVDGAGALGKDRSARRKVAHVHGADAMCAEAAERVGVVVGFDMY
jgi:hypothetical protein